LTDLASDGIDKAAGSLGVSRASGVIKKAVIPKEEEWDSGDNFASLDISYNASSSQKYLNNLFDKLQKTANMPGVSVKEKYLNDCKWLPFSRVDEVHGMFFNGYFGSF
jgi:transglutaminase/protease-like cytokinesis protein 3